MTKSMIYTVKINRIINECKGVKTFIFNVRETDLINYSHPQPGQFLMVWVPGVDEVPMSISGYDEAGNWSITVKSVGECTAALHELRIGDYIGIRGPLGTSFTIPNDKRCRIFLIGGGIGMAPLKFLAYELSKKDLKFTVIEGVKIMDDLMFVDEFHLFEQHLQEALFCTDDGSYGEEGFASEIFEKRLNEISPEEISSIRVYTCGPETMMYKVFGICEKNQIPLEASLERIMRCGCGICGLCALDPVGLLLCKDGPVFQSEVLKKIDDFGKIKREFAGNKINLDNT